MNATASPESAFGGAPGGGPPVIRSIGSCIGWLLLSFGLWGFAWIYNTLTEIGDATGKDTQATLKTVLYIIPIVNLFVLYFTWKDISEFAESTGEGGFSPILYIILSFIPIVKKPHFQFAGHSPPVVVASGLHPDEQVVAPWIGMPIWSVIWMRQRPRGWSH